MVVPESGGAGRAAVVISGAAAPNVLARVLARYPGALVVAADGGLAPAATLDLAVDVIIGDFDSVDERQVSEAMQRGSAVERFACEKDATDLELAVHGAAARGATRIVVVDSTAGRLDHFLGAVSFLASPSLASLDVTAYIDDGAVFVLRGGDEHVVRAPVGATITLLPAGGAAVGITTKGLRYPLCDETLPAGTTRGVSNVVEQDDANVRLRTGVLLVVVPDATAIEQGSDR